MQKLLFLLAITSALGVVSCKDDPEQIPAYVHVDPFTVDAPGGAAWQKITEGWVYVNGEYLGAYTLPADVPVLAEGTADVLVFPGVKENGINSTPNIYPMLTRFEKSVTLVAGEKTQVQPATVYDPDAVFAWSSTQSNLDQGSIVFENRDNDNTTGFVLTTDGAYSQRSLQLSVDTVHQRMEIATEAVVLPNAGGYQTWLELHYNANVRFSVWLLGKSGSAPEVNLPVFQFNASQGWNKTYLNLTSFLEQNPEENYRLFFQVLLPVDATGKTTQSTGKVLLDNIRLIHY